MALAEFAAMIKDTALIAPDKTISDYVICNKIDQGRDRGGAFGAMGRIPGLVQQFY